MDEQVISVAATEIGFNHIRSNKECEDASGTYSDENVHICVVADGHGSDNYPRTRKGSRFAVDAAIECVREFTNVADPIEVVNDERENYSLMLQLSRSILNRWHQKVEQDYNNHPIEENELGKVSEKYRKIYLSDDDAVKHIEKAYGTTLIACAVTSDYFIGLQIGDGKCVVIDERGNFSQPIPWDENCQLNVTTSICDSDAIEEFRFSISRRIPVAVFCGSDGIDDSYANDDEVEALYRSILKIFIEYGPDTGEKEIKEYLPILTEKGSGDDVSISAIIDIRRAKTLIGIFDEQAAEFKQKESDGKIANSEKISEGTRSDSVTDNTNEKMVSSEMAEGDTDSTTKDDNTFVCQTDLPDKYHEENINAANNIDVNCDFVKTASDQRMREET